MIPNNRFDPITLLSRFVQVARHYVATLLYAQTAPMYALRVKRMLGIQFSEMKKERFHVVAFMFISWIHMLVGFMIDSRKFAPSAH